MYARFEVRRLDLAAARRVLGTAIGMCPKECLFKGYIQLMFDVSHLLVLCLSLSHFDSSCASLTPFENYTRNISRFVMVIDRIP